MIRAVLLFLALLLVSPATAAEAPRQVKLTSRLVENFIASYEPVKAFNARYHEKWGDEDFAGSDAKEPARLRQSLEARGALEDFNGLVRRYGFNGVEEWRQVAASVMIAYGFADPEHDAAKAKDEIERALAKLDARKDLTAAQKKRLKTMLETSLANYEAMKPPAGNIDVVRPYRARLDALLEK